MAWPRVAAVLAALVLAACGNPRFDDEFDKSFEKSAKQSCLQSAKTSGAPDTVAEPYCTCFVSRVRAWSTQEKMAINPNSEKFKQVIEACRPRT